MKTLFLASAAAAALFAAPAVAQDAIGSVGVSYANPSIDTDFGDGDAWTYGVGGEYEFANSPFSLTAGYTRADIESVDLDVDSWTIGLRYSFGGGIQARDRAGASLGSPAMTSILAGF